MRNVLFIIYYYYSFGLLRKHKASTTFFHLSLSLALVLASFHVKSEFRSLQLSFFLQVCFGCPSLLFSCGLHSNACLVIFSGSFRRMWPTHRHLSRLIWTFIGCWFVNVHSSAFGTLSNPLKRRIRRRKPLTKVYIFAVSVVLSHTKNRHVGVEDIKFNFDGDAVRYPYGS